MGRPPSFTKEDVAAMMGHLQAEGIEPSVAVLQKRLGGSMSTISKYRKQILNAEKAEAESLADRTLLPAKLNEVARKATSDMARRIWLVAREDAAAEIAKVKEESTAEIEAALAKADDEIQTCTFLKQELDDCRERVSGSIGQIERLKTQHSQAQETIDRQMTEIEKLHQQVVVLEQKERQTFEREVTARERAENAEAQVRRLENERAEIHEAVQKGKGLAAIVEELRSQLTAERSRSEKLERENRDLAVSLGTARAQQQQFQEQGEVGETEGCSTIATGQQRRRFNT